MRQSEIDELDRKGLDTVLREIAEGKHYEQNSPGMRELDAWVLSEKHKAD